MTRHGDHITWHQIVAASSFLMFHVFRNLRYGQTGPFQSSAVKSILLRGARHAQAVCAAFALTTYSAVLLGQVLRGPNA